MTRRQRQQEQLPAELNPHRLRRRALTVMAALTALVLVALLAPGLGEVREKLREASPGWILLGVALELASCLSYALMFKPVFCGRMQWRLSGNIAFSELAVGSIVPASGATGLVLGAWVLRRRGMAAERIARRSVAFFLIKSSANFVAVAVVGTLMALGVGPHFSLALTALPAALSTLTIVLVLALPRLLSGDKPGPAASRVARARRAVRRWLTGGTAEAVSIVKTGNLLVIGGSIGYWAFDNAVLWAMFRALGESPPDTVILIGYLIGQLGGLLPIPGGIGGIDGGLLGTLVVYGTPVAATAAAILAYRLILFWTPLLAGAPAFVWLWRELRQDPEGAAAVP
ncbi:MAG: putative heme transporter [Thermoleophilaceae bacterium]|nr:putative heme transporter [Thermoleophilaceae bacterium]